MADTIQPSDSASATAIAIAASMVFSGEVAEALRNADQPNDPIDFAVSRARLIGKLAAEIASPSNSSKG